MEENHFLSAIEKEASLKEEYFLKRAEEESAKILEAAQKEASRIEESFVYRTEAEIRKVKSRLLTQESLESRRRLLEIKSRFASKVVGLTKETFEALKTGPEYGAIFKKLVAELSGALEGADKKVILRVNPSDEKFVRPFLGELPFQAELHTDPSVVRGVELEDTEGHFRIKNTIDSRLVRAHDAVMQHLNKILFQEK